MRLLLWQCAYSDGTRHSSSHQHLQSRICRRCLDQRMAAQVKVIELIFTPSPLANREGKRFDVSYALQAPWNACAYTVCPSNTVSMTFKTRSSPSKLRLQCRQDVAELQESSPITLCFQQALLAAEPDGFWSGGESEVPQAPTCPGSTTPGFIRRYSKGLLQSVNQNEAQYIIWQR